MQKMIADVESVTLTRVAPDDAFVGQSSGQVKLALDAEK